MADFVHAPVPVNPDDLKQEVFDSLRDQFPGWEPADGNLDVWIVEAFCEIAAQIGETATFVLRAIFRYFGANLIGLQPIEATPATTTVTVTAIDSVGYVVPAGTTIGWDAGGELVAFVTEQDATIPTDSTSVSGVAVVAVTPGAIGSNLSGLAQLIDPLDFVSTVTAEAMTTGGVDAETDDAYLDRLAAQLRLMAPRPIYTDDFAVMARTSVSEVGRALALNGYDPSATVFTGDTTNASATVANVSSLNKVSAGSVISGAGIPAGTKVLSVDPTLLTVTLDTPATATATGVSLTATGSYGNGRTVTVYCVGLTGDPLSSQGRALVTALFEGERVVNTLVFIEDPTYTTVDVDFTFTPWDGWDAADVKAQAEAAVASFLSPSTWGQPTFGETVAWSNETRVRYLEVAQVLQSVEGLRYVDSLSVGGLASGADLDLPGAAPLPRPGTITGTPS